MPNTQTLRGAFLLVTAGIVSIGVVNALRAPAPAAGTTLPTFEVASVKPNALRRDPGTQFPS
jgi:hypothetical protein